MPDQHLKFSILEQFYDLHDRFLNKTIKKTACARGCDTCCTCNVTMTSLETAFLFSSLDSAEKDKLVSQVRSNSPEQRFHPKLTFNGFARLCLDRAELPEEENNPLWGPCPLLKNRECTIYRARPFGCRSLISETPCSKEGFATMPSLVLTFNQVLMQYIEHVDAQGVFGNLVDMILEFEENTQLAQANSDMSDTQPKPHNGLLVQNQPAPVLMVPQEHKQELAPFLSEINKILNVTAKGHHTVHGFNH
ncbi:MAG: YkgJ family cysteine cluster protein [Thermodesulfobacteriota bacterium]|nr:YkgJ family cysteine cluster protein [Thermodesulfobacteriota bacterium]